MPIYQRAAPTAGSVIEMLVHVVGSGGLVPRPRVNADAVQRCDLVAIIPASRGRDCASGKLGRSRDHSPGRIREISGSNVVSATLEICSRNLNLG